MTETRFLTLRILHHTSEDRILTEAVKAGVPINPEFHDQICQLIIQKHLFVIMAFRLDMIIAFGTPIEIITDAGQRVGLISIYTNLPGLTHPAAAELGFVPASGKVFFTTADLDVFYRSLSDVGLRFPRGFPIALERTQADTQ